MSSKTFKIYKHKLAISKIINLILWNKNIIETLEVIYFYVWISKQKELYHNKDYKNVPSRYHLSLILETACYKSLDNFGISSYFCIVVVTFLSDLFEDVGWFNGRNTPTTNRIIYTGDIPRALKKKIRLRNRHKRRYKKHLDSVIKTEIKFD